MADIECPVVRADVTCYWKDMWRRLDAMRRLWQLCDVRLKTDDGFCFMAHSPVLAASSDVLHHMLVAARHETFVDGPGVVPVRNVTPDVLRITLDFIYGVTPTSRADFERLRVGATQLGIEGAYEYCCRRLGESFSIFPHARHAAGLPSDSAVTVPTHDHSVLPLSPVPPCTTTEATDVVKATAVLEPSCTIASNDSVSETEGASVGDRNSSASSMQSDAVVSTLEVISHSSDTVDSTAPSSDIHHAEMMAHMSLADLARPDECPHLRRLAGEILPPPLTPNSNHAAHESSDSGPGVLDPIQLKKHIGTGKSSEENSIREEVSGFCETETVNTGDRDGGVTVQLCTDDLSLSAESVPLMSSRVKASGTCPQAILTDNSIDVGSHCSTSAQSNSASGSTVEFSSPLHEPPSFPTASMLKAEMMAPNDCISYVSDSYGMSAISSHWLTDQHPSTVGTATELPSLTSCVQSPYHVGSFASILSTACMTTDGIPADSVHPSTSDIVHRSSNILHGVTQDTNFTNYGVPLNHWPNAVAAASQGNVSGISQVVSLPADNSMAYFSANLVAYAVPQFLPPVPTVNPLLSASVSTAVPSSVAAAGGHMDDLSYISLDDVSAVLNANGFSDKTSSPSTTEVSPESHTCSSGAAENHTSDVVQTSTHTAVTEAQSAVTRVCIFCQKPCKSER